MKKISFLSYCTILIISTYKLFKIVVYFHPSEVEINIKIIILDGFPEKFAGDETCKFL
jgi:hypothetical protein